MSKKMIKVMEYPIEYPNLYVGSIWMTTRKTHLNHKRRIVGISSNKKSVHVKNVNKTVKQHGDKIYTISADVFIREHHPSHK